MPGKKKTWRQKLEDDKGLPRIFKIDSTKRKRWGAGTCVIPAPREVNALMRLERRGKLTTIDELRKILARNHGSTIACPITTGIFAWIAANASAEAEAAGSKAITPFWRTLKSKGELNPKYPGGVVFLKRKLQSEGHVVKPKGKRFFVENFEKHLANLDA